MGFDLGFILAIGVGGYGACLFGSSMYRIVRYYIIDMMRQRACKLAAGLHLMGLHETVGIRLAKYERWKFRKEL